MSSYKNFKHATPIQIRFSDIDAMNHLNNATYLTYFEVARVKYLDVVTKADWDDTRYGLIVAKAEINFKQPVFFYDTIEVHTRCSKIGNKSF
jgi:acyl-CoA thioester hydrolase